jgi:hypothetical protein
MPVNRSDAEILKAHRDATKDDIRKVDLATVLAVYPARQTVDVQVCTNNPIHDPVGNAFLEPAPNLSDVPLACLRGGGFLVWMPVSVGDSVLIVYSDLSADTWRSGDGSVADPGFQGKHTRDSPFALPMFAPDAKMFSDPASAATKVIIGKDGSQAQIRISDTEIDLGATPTDPVALSTKIDLFIQTVMGWIPVPNDGGAALKTALTSAGFTPATTVAATQVKAQ